MCKTCVQKTRSAVRMEGTLTSFSENKTGLKQDDPLSPILFNLALQKVIQSIKMVPSGIKIGKEQFNVNKTTFCRNCQKVRTTHKPRKNKICNSGAEKQLKTK